MTKSSLESPNPFVLEELYPDVTNIFSTELPPIEEVKDNCLVVLDTSTLLFPYKASQDNLGQITETYKRLIETSRLIVPAHVAREFVENRPTHLTDLHKKLCDHHSKYLPKSENSENYPLLQSLSEFTDLVEIERETEKMVRSLRKKHSNAMKKLLEKVRGWRWNDPVSEIYKSLFAEDVVFEPSIDPAELAKEAERRKRWGIPPGYKDIKTSKTDERNLFGDLKIWLTILEVAKREKNLIFVSLDEKSDWYHQSAGAKLYPRFELAEEYKRASKGKAFYIFPLSRLLELYGVNRKIVREVEQGEALLTTPAHEDGFSPVQEAVADWWRFQVWDSSAVPRLDEFDLDLSSYSEEFLHRTKSFIAQIIEVEDIYSFDINEVRRKINHLSKAAIDQGYNGGKFFLIFRGADYAEHSKNLLISSLPANVELYTSYIENHRLILV